MADIEKLVDELKDLIYGRNGFLEHCAPEGTVSSGIGIFHWRCMTCEGEIVGIYRDNARIEHAPSCAYARAKEREAKG